MSFPIIPTVRAGNPESTFIEKWCVKLQFSFAWHSVSYSRNKKRTHTHLKSINKNDTVRTSFWLFFSFLCLFAPCVSIYPWITAICSHFVGLLAAGPSPRKLLLFFDFLFCFFLFACSHSCVFVSTVNTQLYPHREMTYSFYHLFHRLNAGRNSLMWHSLSTAPTVHLDSTPTRNLSACCSTCATKTVAVSPTCAALELLSISSTASAIGFTTLTARKPTSGTNTYYTITNPLWKLAGHLCRLLRMNNSFSSISFFKYIILQVLLERADLRHGSSQANQSLRKNICRLEKNGANFFKFFFLLSFRPFFTLLSLIFFHLLPCIFF